MTRVPRLALFGLALAAGSAAAQEILFFERPDFNGRRFTASSAVSNMQQTGFNDRAESMIIRGGQWQICTDAQFRGRCVTLNPGEYRNLAQIGLSDQISSARQTGGWGGGSSGGSWGGPGGSGRALTLYENAGFSGRSYDTDGDVSNLDRTGFNDRARSMIIQDGQWEICGDADYRSRCQTYGPGRYASLGSLSGEVSSMRRVGGGGSGGGWGGGGYPPDSWGGQGRVVLYENPGFSGRSFLVQQDELQNFQSLGYNDRASSLRVEGGYWMFCSDANYRGTCRTFGPGDYATLPPGLNNAISSGRRIHNEYPYQQNPSWSGYSRP
jgi:hypothetical protein